MCVLICVCMPLSFTLFWCSGVRCCVIPLIYIYILYMYIYIYISLCSDRRTYRFGEDRLPSIKYRSRIHCDSMQVARYAKCVFWPRYFADTRYRVRHAYQCIPNISHDISRILGTILNTAPNIVSLSWHASHDVGVISIPCMWHIGRLSDTMYMMSRYIYIWRKTLISIHPENIARYREQ